MISLTAEQIRVLVYSEVSYRSLDSFMLYYFYKMSGYGFKLFSIIPNSLDARGASAGVIIFQ